jgi:predicted GNAT family acetyltransferase
VSARTDAAVGATRLGGQPDLPSPPTGRTRRGLAATRETMTFAAARPDAIRRSIAGMDVHVANDPDEERYQATVDDEVVGFTKYVSRPRLIAFVHTEVDERMEGQGVGSKLVRFALDDARSQGVAVLPFCPFVNGYIQRHPEYVDLIPEAHRDEFGL